MCKHSQKLPTICQNMSKVYTLAKISPKLPQICQKFQIFAKIWPNDATGTMCGRHFFKSTLTEQKALLGNAADGLLLRISRAEKQNVHREKLIHNFYPRAKIKFSRRAEYLKVRPLEEGRIIMPQ